MLAVDELSCLLRDETRVIGDGGLVLHFPILELATCSISVYMAG